MMKRWMPLLVAACMLSASPGGAATYAWHIKYAGGKDADTGSGWTNAWATIQKAWTQIDTIMSAAAPLDHTFNIYLEQTTGTQAMAGAASDGEWFAYGGTKIANVNLYGGYDSASGARVGRTKAANPAGDAFRADLYNAHEQIVNLAFHDMDITASGRAVYCVEARPRIIGRNSTFTGTGAVSAVLQIWKNYGGSYGAVAGEVDLERCVVRGGNVGVRVNGAQYRPVYVKMINTAITGQSGASPIGLLLESNNGNGTNPTIGDLRNVTISSVAGGTGIRTQVGGHDYNGTMNLNLDRVLVANVGAVIAHDNNARNDGLRLTGDRNAFYNHTAFSSVAGGGTGGIADGLANSATQPSGDPKLEADGYHLTDVSPLIDAHTWLTGDPADDIDGDPRPLGAKCEIGCDEVLVLPKGTTILIRSI